MHGTKKYVKTTFLLGAAAFSYEGWLSCIAFEEVFKNTLTCDWIIPCRSRFQRTADAPSQSWRPWRRSLGWGSRTRSRAASVSAGPAGQTCPRSREGAFSTVQTLYCLYTATWDTWVFTVSVLPAKKPISFSSLCLYASFKRVYC